MTKYDDGMEVRREVLGDEHVDRATANATEFTRDFQELITEYAWGTIWTRPGLDRRSRSLITLTALVARGHDEELAMHLRAALTNGLTVDEIKETLLQTAIYCGVPAANTAFRIAQQVLEEQRPMTDAFLYAAARTPFGRFGGALAEVRPDDLAAAAMTAVLAKAPDLDPAAIGDVVWGCANQAGEDNRNVGRMAVLLAGLPVSVPAVTVNRLCGSSLDAAMQASRTIESGDADVVLAGGVESMTRAPWVLPKPSRAFPAGNVTAVSTTLGWRLVNERMPAEWTVSLGEANELLADRFSISRERQDEFAARSHKLADAAWEAGFYDDLVVPVEGVDLARDEGIRPGSTAEKLAGLKPSFRPGRDDHGGQRLAAQRRRVGAAARLREGATLGARAAGPDRRPRRSRAGAAGLRVRPGRGGRQGAGPGRDHLGRRGRGRAQRGVRRAVAGLRRRLEGRPRDRQRQGRRDRDRPPARRLRRPDPRHPRAPAAESGDRWGVAAICIGVGQALAVVLENVTENVA